MLFIKSLFASLGWINKQKHKFRLKTSQNEKTILLLFLKFKLLKRQGPMNGMKRHFGQKQKMLFCEGVKKKKRRRSKASLFSALPKLPSLVRDFPALHRHLQHLQPFQAPPGTLPGRYRLTRVHSGFVPHYLGPHKRGTDSPMLLALNLFSFTFPGAFSAESSHLTSIHRLFSPWISHRFDLCTYELISLELLMQKIVFSVVLYEAKSTESTAQMNTAISLPTTGRA